MGKIVTPTDQGEWFGPVLNGIPIYQGVYSYKDNRLYEGCCLSGKREGKGVLKFPNGNTDLINNINGTWKNDELTFPSTIMFVDVSYYFT